MDNKKPNMRQGPNKAMIGMVFIINRSNQKLFIQYITAKVAAWKGAQNKTDLKRTAGR